MRIDFLPSNTSLVAFGGSSTITKKQAGHQMCYSAPLFSMAANGFGCGRDRSSHPIHMFPQEEKFATLGELTPLTKGARRRRGTEDYLRQLREHTSGPHVPFPSLAPHSPHKGTRIQSFKALSWHSISNVREGLIKH